MPAAGSSLPDRHRRIDQALTAHRRACCLLLLRTCTGGAQLHTSYPQLPLLGLVDWNPAGVAILATYKLGSRRMGLEAVEYAVPGLAWLGVLADMLQVRCTTAAGRLAGRAGSGWPASSSRCLLP